MINLAEPEDLIYNYLGNCLIQRKILKPEVHKRLCRAASGTTASSGAVHLGIDDTTGKIYKNALYEVVILYMSEQNSAGATSNYTINSDNSHLVQTDQYIPNKVENGAYNAFIKMAWFKATADTTGGFLWTFPSNNGVNWRWWTAFHEYKASW